LKPAFSQPLGEKMHRTKGCGLSAKQPTSWTDTITGVKPAPDSASKGNGKTSNGVLKSCGSASPGIFDARADADGGLSESLGLIWEGETFFGALRFSFHRFLHESWEKFLISALGDEPEG
jgi:hypothetical protein